MEMCFFKSRLESKITPRFRAESVGFEYDKTYHDNDISLLYLDAPLRFSDTVGPVHLPRHDVPVGTECIVAGYGFYQGMHGF